jgi:hypothetical protein
MKASILRVAGGLAMMAAGAWAQAPVGPSAFEKMAIDGSIRRIRSALVLHGEQNPDRLIRALRVAAEDMSPEQARKFLETVERGLGQGLSMTAIGGNGGGGKSASPKGKSGLSGSRGLDSPKGLDSARGL